MLRCSRSQRYCGIYSSFTDDLVLRFDILEPPRQAEVINLINSLNLHKAVGHDNISPHYFLAPALCYLFDHALNSVSSLTVVNLPKFLLCSKLEKLTN